MFLYVFLGNEEGVFELVERHGFGLAGTLKLCGIVDGLNYRNSTILTNLSRLRLIRNLIFSDGRSKYHNKYNLRSTRSPPFILNRFELL